MRELPDNLRQVDWTLTSWEGSRREQMRRWAALPLDRIVASLEEMEELTRMFRGASSEGDVSDPTAVGPPTAEDEGYDPTPSRRNAMDVRHEPESRRFAVPTENGEAVLKYEPIDDETLDFTSTFVPKADREEGVGEDLVLHALDWARDHDFHVVPTCPFVRRVIDEHPEYADLVAVDR